MPVLNPERWTNAEETSYVDRETWLAARAPTIGSSDAPTIYGANRWKARYRLWGEKLGLVESRAPRDAWGNMLEDGISRGYAAETGDMILTPKPFTIHRNPSYPWAHATCDRFINNVGRHIARNHIGVQEIKSTGGWAAADWIGQVPDIVNVQVQHQLAITELEWAVAVALIGGFRFTLVWRLIERDELLISDLMEKEREFVEMINTRTPPEIDGSDESREVLEAIYPNSNGKGIDLPDYCEEIDAKIVEAEQLIANTGLNLALWKNQIREAIGDATFGRLPSGNFWKNSTGKDGQRRLRRKARTVR